MRFATLVMVFAATSVVADTEIFRCPLQDGTIAFQETPCSGPAAIAEDGGSSGDGSDDGVTSAAEEAAFGFVNPFDETLNPPTATEATPPEPVSQDRSECEKTTRDAIDAIDLEMRANDYTQAEGRQYLARLLTLTQQLRECKTL